MATDVLRARFPLSTSAGFEVELSRESIILPVDKYWQPQIDHVNNISRGGRSLNSAHRNMLSKLAVQGQLREISYMVECV